MVRSPRPARILYLDHVAEISGAEASLLALLSGLDRSAFEPLVVLPHRGPLSEALDEMGVGTRPAPLCRPKRTLNPSALMRSACQIASARRHVARMAREWGADLIHASSTAAALQAPNLRGVPIVWHCRDLVRLGPLARILRARSAAIIAISRAVREHLIAELGDGRKIRLIYNGVNTERFAPGPADPTVRAQLGVGPEHFLAGMVGQLVPWKGHRLFLGAAAQVAQRVADARFAIVGADVFGDHPQYEHELRALSRDLGVQDLVAFAGHRQDMPEVMRALDALVQPSVPEPFGRAVAEAMSAGKPVVAFDCAGPAEIIVDGVSGILVPPSDPQAIAKALVAVATDPDRARRIGAAGRARVCERFSLEAHVETVQTLYRELTERPKP